MAPPPWRRWHHIYLPMLPQAFKDYLSAPMPFMVGLQSQMLHMLSAIPMDEIRVVDLDIHSCQPPPGSPHDDARILPWREQLEAALTAVHKVIRSPTEHETSPLIASESTAAAGGRSASLVPYVPCALRRRAVNQLLAGRRA